jgi:hypothetical protein
LILDATAADVKVTDDRLIVELADGRELSAPLPGFPVCWTRSQRSGKIGG